MTCRPSPARALMVASVVACSSLSCGGENQDPARADDLLARVRAAGYTGWRRAPGVPVRQPSFTAHAGAVDVYVNDVVAAAIDDPSKMTRTSDTPAWPKGSVVVKEGYSGSTLSVLAIMERREVGNDGWFFAEYSGSGTALYSGKPAVCVECHAARAAYSDWLFTLEQPR